ncbi:hypothetical protein E2562_007355 [Oryza meyeriana var. granulata]|uniref:Uncharacterized protein n=1 Tax=Oryza meyeriana var. granulata TaxID=110450 RepID=A0A6G1CYN9_9ORYZ|nr:hypothetical protein E2562_007355 [Oryza meyeriana var. granulata]
MAVDGSSLTRSRRRRWLSGTATWLSVAGRDQGRGRWGSKPARDGVHGGNRERCSGAIQRRQGVGSQGWLRKMTEATRWLQGGVNRES